MVQYAMPIPTRPEWQKLRDSNKVPKGAAKVSIGDSLDGVHKTLGLNTLSKHQQAVTKLGKDVDAYLATITKSYPKFVPVVDKELKRKIAQHNKFLSDQVKAKTEFYPRYAAIVTAYDQLRLHGKGKPKDVAKAMERLLGCLGAFALLEPSYGPKRQALNKLMGVLEGVDTLNEAQLDVVKKALVDLDPKMQTF